MEFTDETGNDRPPGPGWAVLKAQHLDTVSINTEGLSRTLGISPVYLDRIDPGRSPR